MKHISGNPTPTNKLIYRLRLMAGAGGMLTRDRIKTISDAADRLEEYDERISKTETQNMEVMNNEEH